MLGGGSLGWSLDGVYIHQVPSKKLSGNALLHRFYLANMIL
jgi:hypothetical protein